jgi:molybdopterin-biosynthesis enzyme MoeA-like protein
MQSAHFLQTISALSLAGLVYLGEAVSQHIPGVPEWITSLGFPVGMLVAVIYALVATHRSYQAVVAARIADRDAHESRLQDMISRSQESREKLIIATERQTIQLEAQTAQLCEQTKRLHELAEAIESRKS